MLYASYTDVLWNIKLFKYALEKIIKQTKKQTNKETKTKKKKPKN